MSDLLLQTGAMFSDCGRYRYRLWREWDDRRPTVTFIMLNPSTADDTVNDPTVERCQRRARRLGFGRLDVANLFAWRSTDRSVLATLEDPIGPDNDAAILDACERAAIIICAWGADGHIRCRGAQVRAMLHAAGWPLHYLKLIATGEPQHPLYIGYDVKPELWPSGGRG